MTINPYMVLDATVLEEKITKLEALVGEVRELARELHHNEVDWGMNRQLDTEAWTTRLNMWGEIGTLMKVVLNYHIPKVKTCLAIAKDMESKLREGDDE